MISDHPYIDPDAQTSTAWLEWSEPTRIQAQVDLLFCETLPTVPGLVPVPDEDRYSHAVLTWMTDPFEALFPDENSLYSGKNTAAAERFVCYLGEWLRVNAGGVWFNYKGAPDGSVLFGLEFTPSIAYPFTDSIDDLTDLVFQAVELRGGTDFNLTVGSDLYSRTVEYAEYKGTPHELDVFRQRSNLT